MGKLHKAALSEVSRLRLDNEALRGRLSGYDQACLELSQIKSKCAEEIKTVSKQHDERMDRLKKEAAEEKKRLTDKGVELEEKVRDLKHCVVAKDVRIKWHQDRLTQLDDELARALGEADNKQLKIDDLVGRVKQVKADKLRAFGEVEELKGELARRETEVEKTRSEGQAQLDGLQKELSLARGKNSELERRATEFEEQVLLLQDQFAKAVTQAALLRGEQDAISEEAFQMGKESVRARISREHPEWDLSFLDAELLEIGSPESEEDEYVDVSDADADTAPGASKLEVPEGRSQPSAGEATTFEVGEASQASQDAPDKPVEAVPPPDL